MKLHAYPYLSILVIFYFLILSYDASINNILWTIRQTFGRLIDWKLQTYVGNMFWLKSIALEFLP